MAEVTVKLDSKDKESVIHAYMIVRELYDLTFFKIKEVKIMDAEQMKTALHETRKEVDANIQKVGELKKTSINQLAGRELALVYTKLQEAKMWLGKCLESIGSELPAEFQDKA